MFAFRAIKPARIVRSVRKFSGHSEAEAEAEVAKWYKISIGAVAFSLLSTAYILATDEHPHIDRPGLYRINTKPFPWECSDCGLFDQGCWDECKGRGKKEHH